MKNPLPEDLFKILACPKCKSSLKYSKDKNFLICNKCKVKYPLEDGIAVLMPCKEQKL